MKKKNTFILIFVLSIILISLSSCTNTNKINSKRIKNIDSFIYIDEYELIDLLKHDQDFILVIGENGCSTCDYIKTSFISFIKKYETLVYWIEYTSYQKVANKEEYNLKTNILTSTVFLIDDGEIYKQIDYDAELYFSKDKLEFTLSKYISLKGIYDINDYEIYKYNEEVNMYKIDIESHDKLDELIYSNNRVSILYSWKECIDCQDFKKMFLNDFIKSYNGTLYEYEVDYIRSKRNEDGSFNLDEFTAFANEKEFSSYRGGKVPTIVTYENGKKIDMIVFSNDVIEEKDNGYYVKESFFDSLVNKQNNDKLALRNDLLNEQCKFIKEYLIKHI